MNWSVRNPKDLAGLELIPKIEVFWVIMKFAQFKKWPSPPTETTIEGTWQPIRSLSQTRWSPVWDAWNSHRESDWQSSPMNEAISWRLWAIFRLKLVSWSMNSFDFCESFRRLSWLGTDLYTILSLGIIELIYLFH